MTSPLYVNNDQIIKSNIFLASISVVVSVFTIIMFLSKKTLYTFQLGMMFGIAVSEMINGIGYILSFCLLGVTKETIATIDNSIVCNMKRFFTIYPDLATSLFLIFFAYDTYDLIKNNSTKLEKKTTNILIIGFIAIFIDRNELAVRTYFILIHIQDTFFSLRGLILFIIFVNNNKVKRILRDILEKVFGKIDKIKILEIIKEHEDEYEIAESPQETLDNNLSEDYNK